MTHLSTDQQRIAVLIYGEYRTFDICRPRMRFLDDSRVDIYFVTYDQTHYKIPDYIDVTEEITESRIRTTLNKDAIIYIKPKSDAQLYQYHLVRHLVDGITMIKSQNIDYSHIVTVRTDIFFDECNTIEIDDLLVESGCLGAMPYIVNTNFVKDLNRSPSSEELNYTPNKFIKQKQRAGDLSEEKYHLSFEMLRSDDKTKMIHDLIFSSDPQTMYYVFSEDFFNLWASTANELCTKIPIRWHAWLLIYLRMTNVRMSYIDFSSEQNNFAICRYYVGDDLSMSTVNQIAYDWLELKHYSNHTKNHFVVPNFWKQISKKLAAGYYDKYRVSKITHQ